MLGVALSVSVALLCVSAAGAQQDPSVSWPSERAPRPLPAREVKFPPYEVRTLDNGMQVVAVLHHEQPAVTMRLLVRAGAAQDPERKAGLAGLLANLLDQGTATRSAQQIADQIDSIGGALGTGSGSDLTFANAVVMKDSFGLAMDLLSDVVRNPAFSPEEIDRQRQQVMSSLQVSSNDPDYIASTLFDRLVYGFHPYGLPGSGTPETILGITREDLTSFHRQYFVPNNMILAIVGDVTSQEAFDTAQKIFGAWPRGDVATAKAFEPPPPTRRVVVVDKPDSVQTEIRVGQLGIPRKHPDYLAFDLAVKILGGEGANRLHRILRSERGLTYGASAETEAMKQAGDFVAETDTRTETTGEALRLMVDEFGRLQRQRVFERELADAQAYLAGSFPLTIETPNDIATQILNAVFYELPMQEITTFRERVQAVTPDDIQRVAQQYVRPDRLSIVLVGNARAFLPQLRAVGFGEIDVIPIEDLDLMSATLRREQRRVVELFGSFDLSKSFGRFDLFAFSPPGYTRNQVNPRAGDLQSARTRNGSNDSNDSGLQNVPNAPNVPNDPKGVSVLRRVVDVRGGLAALKGVRTMVADANTTFQLAQKPLASMTKTYVIYPDKFRVDATVEGQQVVQIYNAGRAWMKDPGGVREAPPPVRDDFAASVRREAIPLLIAASEGRLTVRLLPTDEGAGKGATVLELSGSGVDPVKLVLDDQMRIVKQSFVVSGPDGRQVVVEEVFSDYRNVTGIQMPFEAEVLHDGRPIMTRTLTNVALNIPVDEGLFQRPR